MITWGGRPPEPRASGWQRAALALSVLLAAVAAGVPDRFVAREPSIIGPETPGTIQGLFEIHLAAIERGDRIAFENTLDPRSPPFVACMRRLFELGRARADALAPARVAGLEHLAGTNLVRVRLHQRDGVRVHYERRFLICPVTSFAWIDLQRAVPAWYISRPDAELRAG